jgi:choline dehydrogenase
MSTRGSWSYIIAIVVAATTAGCAAESAGDDDACQGGKCDDSYDDANDPYRGLGDIETTDYEYIVVGSGAGGGPLAANLARQGHSVLLLEAGKETGGKTEYQVPVRHPIATETEDLAWWYFVEHYGDLGRAQEDTKYTDEGILYPRGGALGGSTAVNAMITVLPPNSDWDGIAAETGDASWASGNMAQYYDRVTRWLGVERQDVNAEALFDTRILSVLTGAFKESSEAGLGIVPHVDLFNVIGNLFSMYQFLRKDINEELLAGTASGPYQFPLATKDHRRNGTREYLISTEKDPRQFPLRIKTQALVTKVIFADAPEPDGTWRATGVEFQDGAHLYSADLRAAEGSDAPRTIRARATREVILSAGVFNTPQLLMLSGVGASDELAEHGIPVKVDLPGVGKNLQDRYEVGVVSEMSDDFTAFRRCTFNADENDPCYRDWTRRRGAYTSNGSVLSILMKSDPSQPEPDLHIFGLPGVFKGYYPGYSADANRDQHHFTWVVLKGHTQNRGGTVKLESADPRVRPAINFHYFDDGDVDNGEDVNDLTAVVNGVEFVRKIANRTDSVDLFTTWNETWPGRDTDDRAEIGEWVKKEAWGHHASCSAKIGGDADPTAVLDSRFRVRGTTGLRVVDASVFPRIPGTFIVLPIYMVSEKATDTLLEDIGETRNEANFPQ